MCIYVRYVNVCNNIIYIFKEFLLLLLLLTILHVLAFQFIKCDDFWSNRNISIQNSYLIYF